MSRGTGVGRFERHLLGNIHREGIEYCTRRVRERALKERKVHSGVTLFVSDDGDVYAPCSEGPNAMYVGGRFPEWIVVRYRFKPPASKTCRAEVLATMPDDETTPTVGDIAEDINFHIASRGAKEA